MDREYNDVIYRPQLAEDEELDNFLSFGKGLLPDLIQRKKDDEFDLEMQAVRPQGITRKQGLDILNRFSHLIEKRRDTDVLGHYQSKHTDLWERCFVLRRKVKSALRLTCELVKSGGDLVSILMNMRSMQTTSRGLVKDVKTRKWYCYAVRWVLYLTCFGLAVVCPNFIAFKHPTIDSLLVVVPQTH